MNLQFIGGAETVTGSKYLLTYKGRRILVDCGLFQGFKSLRLKNWDGFPVDVSEIDCIILTHAHIDHSGFIPRLIKKGFTGKVYSTPATRDLCAILLPDAGHIMEEEAAYLNKTRRTKHNPALPLFNFEEGRAALAFFETVNFHEEREIFPGLSFHFFYAGHILGAAGVIIKANGRTLGFTGDIGRLHDPIFHAPDDLPAVDYLITESTYGDRAHPKSDLLEQLTEVINKTYSRQGVILIPAFAVGRAQSLIYYLYQLRKRRAIPEFPMYLNSPMAYSVGRLLKKHKNLHKLSAADCDAMDETVQWVQDAEQSKALNARTGPMLIISASGMCTGGRILHHLKAFARDERSTVLLTGFQAAGTRGEALHRGAEEIKIHGEYVPVKAEVVMLENVSAHADYAEITEWFKKSKISPRRVFITHGEPAAAEGLRQRLTDTFGWECAVPKDGETADLR